MANKIQEGKFSGTSHRQKGVAIAVVVVVLILIWQIIGIFRDQKPTPPPVKAPVTPGAQATQNTNTASPTGNDPEELTRAKIVNEPSFIKMQKATEEKYVVKLNELEELRIQRQIAETNQAIAAAKLATVTAEKDISDLLTKPNAPSVPPSVYSEQLVNPSTTVQQNATENIPPPVTSPIADYTLISVSMQLRKWSAVIGFQGRLITVNIGDSLPDSSVVVNIDKNSVVIRKDGETKRISIVSSI